MATKSDGTTHVRKAPKTTLWKERLGPQGVRARVATDPQLVDAGVAPETLARPDGV
jgi:hypothetical protein